MQPQSSENLAYYMSVLKVNSIEILRPLRDIFLFERSLLQRTGVQTDAQDLGTQKFHQRSESALGD